MLLRKFIFFSFCKKKRDQTSRCLTDEQKKAKEKRRHERLNSLTSPERKILLQQQQKNWRKHRARLTEERKNFVRQKNATSKKEAYQKTKMNGVFKNLLMNKYYLFFYLYIYFTKANNVKILSIFYLIFILSSFS